MAAGYINNLWSFRAIGSPARPWLVKDKAWPEVEWVNGH